MARKTPKQPYARLAITLPPGVLAAADRLARRMDRSRSWVIAESIRRFAAGESPPRVTGGVAGLGATAYGASEVKQARQHHVEAALALSPAERLHRADELAGLARLVHPRPPRTRIIGFETLEDFAEWKRSEAVRLPAPG